MITAPKITARDADERAPTVSRVKVGVSYLPPDGDLFVEVFESLDDEDRGGVVLRFETTERDYGFIAHAEETENGVDLHFPGDGEAAAFLHALQVALAVFKQKKAEPAMIQSTKVEIS